MASMHVIDGLDEPTERPLALYTKSNGTIIVLLKGMKPLIVVPGETFTISYTVTDSLELVLNEPSGG